MDTPNLQDATTVNVHGAGKALLLPGNGVPNCQARTVADNQEVMLPDGTTWNFLPPDFELSASASQEVESIKKTTFFQSNPNLEEDFDLLYQYVSQLWLIDDHFGDHSQRRIFYERYPEISLYCGKISKLRKNIISYIYYAFHTINSRLPKQVESSLSNIPNDLRNYDALSFGEKKDFTRRIDQAICDFLKKVHDMTKQ